MTYEIVRHHGTAADLERKVQSRVEQGFEPIGGPFYWDEAREWCQAMMKRANNGFGEVQLKEPEATAARQCPSCGLPMTHGHVCKARGKR